jgi:hypothetical protein
MQQQVITLQTEGTPAVVSNKDYIPDEADYYSQYGNVVCVCGTNRYDPSDRCRSCKSTEIGEYQVASDERHLLTSKTAIKTRFWYHSTTRVDWDKEIMEAGIPVHLGNLHAAHERAEHEYDGGNGSYTVYKILLSPFASISDTVCPDLVNGWSSTTEDFRKNAQADFVRYVNTAENVGTVSLIGDPRKFIILGKETHNIQY